LPNFPWSVDKMQAELNRKRWIEAFFAEDTE